MTTDVRTFEDLGVDPTVVKALADADITSPFPIQELSLPMALAGADLIGQARTGTGKTLAFGIPLVQRADPAASHTQALVIVPTRELCLQVHDDLTLAGAQRDVQVVAAYGGRAIDPQSEAIAAGAAIVVGTPGRLLDLCRRRLLDLSRVRSLVLDEADEMLDMGFLPDVEQLIERCPTKRQTLLFSATMPSEVVKLARRYMDKPTFMRTDVEQQQHVAPETRQHFFACHRLDKPSVVARILAAPGRGRTLIFTRTKRMADLLAAELRDRDIDAGVIHSDLRQEARERALAKFRRGAIDVLCATEVAARGLDIDEVTHVINYDCPDDERMYLHRIGRTGRAGAAGVAVTLAVWNELARLDMIKRALDIDQPTEEVLSTSPVLDDLFGTAAPIRRGGSRSRTERSRGNGGSRGDGARRDRSDGDGGRSGGRSRNDTSRRNRPGGGSTRGGGSPGSEADRDTSDRTTSHPKAARGNESRSDSSDGESRDRGSAGTRPTGSTSDDPGSVSDPAARPERRTRSRRRRRRRTDTRSAPAAGDPSTSAVVANDDRSSGDQPADQAVAPSSVAPGDADGTGRADVTATPASGDGGATAWSAGDGERRENRRGEVGGGRSSGSEQGAESRTSRSSRGSRQRRRSGRGGRRSGRSDTRRPADERMRDREAEQVAANPGQPRGDGRPTLNRPMRITHLP